MLLYGDESEALTHPYLARVWAKSGADLRVPAPERAKKVAMLGSPDHVTRELIVHTSATKPVVLVEDNRPIHVSKLSRAALAARSHWLTVEWLPKYAPELNDIEPVWHDLKAHHLAHQTFTDAAANTCPVLERVASLRATDRSNCYHLVQLLRGDGHDVRE